MNHLFLSLLFIGSLALVSAEAEPRHEIDHTLQKKLDSSHSNREMCDALFEASNQWDAQMNKSYRYLSEKLNKDAKASLKKAQIAWLAFRDAEINTQGIILANAELGSMGTLDASDSHYEMIKSRALQLANYESAIRLLDDSSDSESSVENQIKSLNPGNPDRQVICDAFRVPMKKEVAGQPIVFLIHQLNQYGDWAFIHSALQLHGGEEVNWSITKHQDAEKEGLLENSAVGLLKRNAQNTWEVIEHSFGHTDAFYLMWADAYQLPQNMFVQ